MTEHQYWAIVGILLLVALALPVVIVILSQLIGPARSGSIKDMSYESGVPPIHSARRRFHVRFYTVAMLFLLFDVEIIFLYPWSVLFRRLKDASIPEGVKGDYATFAAATIDRGFGQAWFVGVIAIFFALLTIGFIYEWRKGVFKWQ